MSRNTTRAATRLAARLVAASTFLCALPAAAQGDLITGPGASPRGAFLDAFGTAALNDLNALGGTTPLDFGALGTATLSGAVLQANRIVDTGGDGIYTLTFSRPVDGFGAEFSQAAGDLSLTFLSGGATVGTFATALSNPGVTFLGVSGFSFDALQVQGEVGGRLRTDNLVVGLAAVSAVPEPGTLALLGLGLAGTALVARRRRLVALAGGGA